MRIFLDADILIAACGNPEGGSAYLFHIAAHEKTWQLLTSAYAIGEAGRNITHKLPQDQDRFDALIIVPHLTVIYPPSKTLLDLASRIVPSKDAPILAAALSAQSEWLCTLDIKHLHTHRVRQWCARFGMQIVTPKDLLMRWRDAQKSAHTDL